jgi:Flp pilus assembly protein TadG
MSPHPLRRLRRGHDERGYFSILTIIFFVTLFGLAAFAVDVGNWYLTGQQAQRAADAGALAGVPNLPGDKPTAYSTAKNFSSQNGFADGVDTAVVTAGLDGTPTRLRVTVSKTVNNVFGGLFGIPTTTITRTAVADFAGPVPMGSPCNEFGNDPEASGIKSANCSTTGQFWANVGSPAAPKRNGDAYQDNVCTAGDNGCSGTINQDYDPNGYFYTLTLTQPVSNLVIQAFDPALIDVGDLCASNATNNLAGAAALPASRTVVTNPSTRYAVGASSPYCTGDIRYGGTGQVSTKYTIRTPGGNPWDPTSFPVSTSPTCLPATYTGFTGDLSKALDKTNAQFNATVAANFRQWKPLCTIASAPAGTYMIQVNTNGLGADAASGHNRFALRAYSSSSSTAKDTLFIAGFNKMAIYANLTSATTLFYLARVPTGFAGQILSVRLFDVGDSSANGTITVLAPTESAVTFTNCTGVGPTSGTLAGCSVTANSTTYQGKWQTISVPIPSGYTCNDSSATGCWIKLRYAYGSGAQPSDTTSWTANIEGDPVRLVE